MRSKKERLMNVFKNTTVKVYNLIVLKRDRLNGVIRLKITQLNNRLSSKKYYKVFVILGASFCFIRNLPFPPFGSAMGEVRSLWFQPKMMELKSNLIFYILWPFRLKAVRLFLEAKLDYVFSGRFSKYSSSTLVRDVLKANCIQLYICIIIIPLAFSLLVVYYVVIHNFFATTYGVSPGLTAHQIEWMVYGSDSRIYQSHVSNNTVYRYFPLHIWYYLRVEYHLWVGVYYDVPRFPNAFAFSFDTFDPITYVKNLSSLWGDAARRPAALKSPVGRYFVYFFLGDEAYDIQAKDSIFYVAIQLSELATRIAYLPGDMLAAFKIACDIQPDASNLDFALYNKFYRMRDVVWFHFRTTVGSNYVEIKRFLIDWVIYSGISAIPLFQAIAYVTTLLWYSFKFFCSNDFSMGCIREGEYLSMWLLNYPWIAFVSSLCKSFVHYPHVLVLLAWSWLLKYLIGPWSLMTESFLYVLDSLYQGLGFFLEAPYNRVMGIEPFHVGYGILSILDAENHLVFHPAGWLPDLWMIFIPIVYFLVVFYLVFLLINVIWFIFFRPLALLYVLIFDSTANYKPRSKSEIKQIILTQLVVFRAILTLKYLIFVEYFRLLYDIHAISVLSASQDNFDVAVQLKPLIQPLIDQFFDYYVETDTWVKENLQGCEQMSTSAHYALLQKQEQRRLDAAAARESLDGWSNLGNPDMPGQYEFITQMARLFTTPWAYGWAVMGVVGLSRRGAWARLFYDGIALNVLNPLIAYDGTHYVTNPAEDYPSEWEIWDRMIEQYYPALDYLIPLYYIEDCENNEEDSYAMIGNSAEQLVGVHRWFLFLFLTVAVFAGVSWICFRSVRELINSYWFTALVLHTYGMVLIFEIAYGISFIDYVTPGGAWFDSWALWKDTMLSGNGDLTSCFDEIKLDLMERVLNSKRSYLWAEVHQGRAFDPNRKKTLVALYTLTALCIRSMYIAAFFRLTKPDSWGFWCMTHIADMFEICTFYLLKVKFFLVTARRWVRGDDDDDGGSAPPPASPIGDYVNSDDGATPGAAPTPPPAV